MPELTWQDLDRLEAERKAKIRDCTDRLVKILAKEFSFNELQLITSNALGMNALHIEAFELARQNTKRR
jgi:hypothetical protein